MNNKKYNQFGVILAIGLAGLVFVYNDFLCLAESCYELEVAIFEPLFFGLLGITLILLFLLFFSGQVFMLWLKHIAWWFMFGTTFLVLSIHPYSAGVLSIDRTEAVIYIMSIFFIITLIYAPLMSKKLKKNS